MSNSSWPEVQKAFDTKRFELILVGAEISKRIEDNDGKLDNNLFKLKNLNLLEIAKTKLSFIPKEINQIENLTSFLCHSNELTSLPAEFGQLIHLKNLDLSNNKLNQLPNELSNLKELFTLNLGGNQLTSLFPLNNLSKLAVLDINRNKFKKLPDDLGSSCLENLSQINASFNELEELSESLAELPSLKVLNLENNHLTHVPSNLCQCLKLKELMLKENKLKDNRFKKLVEQDKFKPIIDYLERIFIEESKKKPVKAKTSTTKKKSNKENNEIILYDLIKVLHSQDDKFKSKEILLTDSAAEIRPFILCTILRRLDLETNGNLKKFLNIQTKLHDEECQKRTLATIATHDLNNINGNLSYESAEPERIQLVPLGRKYPIYASEFYEKLMDEAEAERKAKKRNQLSGIYKYLTLVQQNSKFIFLKDSTDVISLPPLTNAEKTKMSVNTKDILVEITSTDSLDICKKVMEKMLNDMIEAGIVSITNELETKLNDLSLQTDNAESNEKLRHVLLVQQVKIIDSKGNMKHVYPSRLDLNYETLNKKVIRLYDE